MFNMEKFARLITEKRKDKGLTQGQLSELIGVTHQAVSKWERAEAMPEISKIGDIAKALDTPADEFMNAMYDSKEKSRTENDTTDADEAYFKLEDKTRVGDVYSLAPKMSKPVLELAIDTLISSKGAAAAGMLYRFADREYLTDLGNVLFKKGDTSLVEYVDESLLHSAIIDIISLDPEMRICVDRVGKLLTYCKDADFVNNMFDYMLVRHTYWNPWKGYISKFPSDAIVTQGIKMAVAHGPNCFYNWWDVIGRRNVAKIFIGYVENFEKNNARAWKDISRNFGYADSSIMEKYIKERLTDGETDPQIFKPLYNQLSVEMKETLSTKGVGDEQPQSNGGNQRINKDVNFLREALSDRIAEEIYNIDIEDLPDYLDRIKALGIDLRPSNSNISDTSTIIAKLDEIIDLLDDLDGRMCDLESRIDDLE